MLRHLTSVVPKSILELSTFSKHCKICFAPIFLGKRSFAVTPMKFLRKNIVHVMLLLLLWSAWDTAAIAQHDSTQTVMATDSSSSPVVVADRRLYFTNHPDFNFDAPVVSRLETPFQSPDRTRLFYFCFGMVLFLGVVRSSFTKYVSDIFRVFYRSNFRQYSLREQLSQNKFPSLLLNLLFFLNAAMFLNLLLDSKAMAGRSFWENFGLLSLGLIVLYGGKFIVIQFAGWLLHAKEVAGTYGFIVFLVNKIIGIVLLPVVILMAIGYQKAAEIGITIALVAVGLLLLYRFVQAFQLIKSKRQTNPVHFFIYFCAFELLPLALIGKFAMTALATSSWTNQ